MPSASPICTPTTASICVRSTSRRVTRRPRPGLGRRSSARPTPRRGFGTRTRHRARKEPGPGIADQFDFVDWQPNQRIGPFEVTTTRVDHPVEAYAIRVTETQPGGGTLVFSGDTGPSPALVSIAQNADLLLIEASFLDVPGNPTGLHLNGREAAAAGSAAGVGTVVLTHIPPWHDRRRVLTEATPHFAGPVQSGHGRRPLDHRRIGCGGDDSS